LSPTIALLVLAAAMAHACWNTLLKRGGGDRLALAAALTATYGCIAAPMLFIVGVLPAAALPYLALSVILHIGYNFFLLRAYRLGEMSQVYPLARGAAPLIAAGLSFLFLREVPHGAQMLGIALTAGGVIALSVGGAMAQTAATAALATACCIAAYTVADAAGARAADFALQYAAWLLAVEAAGFIAVLRIVCGKTLWRRMRGCAREGALGGTLAAFAYALVLYALREAPVGAVAALRETAVVFGALFAVFFLGEKMRPLRIIAAVVIAAGVALIVSA
jgi:drug/metabolite transporter (DMT)-like permease